MMCKFYHECEYASSKAFTCTQDAGGNYCGKYRILAFGCQEYGNFLKEHEYQVHAMEILV
jgi:hypothetical protein